MSNTLYLALPRQLQNLALSAYGRNLYRQRFIGIIPEEYMLDLTPFRELTEADLHNQKQRLRQLLQHCKDYVPYYQTLLKGVNTEKITQTDLMSLVPTVTKADIKRDPDLFVSTRADHGSALRTANTSGSSGTPLSVRYTDEARRLNYLFFQRALQLFGCHYRSRSTTFAGRILYKSPGNHPDRYDFYNNTQYLSSYFIADDTVKDYVSALNRWAPDFIDTYPSAILELIKLAQQQQLQFTFSPKCVLTSSETLTAEARTLIETVFNTKVIDQYGCTEMAISAVSIGESYFLDPMYALVEFQHSFESSYEIITTGLLNFGMPLLRYRIGDLAEKLDNDPYSFTSIEGRIDDVIITPEGKRIGRMDPVFKGVEGIESAQIIQERIDRICIKIILSSNSDNKFNPHILINNIKERTSSMMHINIQYVSEIPKSANGKFKSVVSKI
jgi:phenylacetate-CoA ligase